MTLFPYALRTELGKYFKGFREGARWCAWKMQRKQDEMNPKKAAELWL